MPVVPASSSPSASSCDDGRDGDRFVCPDARVECVERGGAGSDVDEVVGGLDEEVNGAAAGETDGEGLVVGIAERDDAGRGFTGENRERFGHDGTFDASTADRTNDLTRCADGHGCAGFARS